MLLDKDEDPARSASPGKLYGSFSPFYWLFPCLGRLQSWTKKHSMKREHCEDESEVARSSQLS